MSEPLEPPTKSIIELFIKERNYQKCAHGEYIDIDSLNIASFIIIIETYLNKLKNSYADKWSKNLPEWLIDCKENRLEGSAPVDAYEELIKIFALSGAALETYTDIDVSKWRENIQEDLKKWAEEPSIEI